MPRKFIHCVRKVSRAEMERYGYLKYNPYAVCRVSTGYKGSTHDIGLLRPARKKRKKKKGYLHHLADIRRMDL